MVNKRVFLLMSLFLVIFSFLLGRIFYCQVVKGETISKEAIAMRSQEIDLREYNRGDILDRNLAPLTSTRTSSALYFLPGFIDKKVSSANENSQAEKDKIYRQTAKFLAQVLKDRNEQKIFDQINEAGKRGQFVRIDDNLSATEIEQVNSADLTGLKVAPIINRYEYYGFMAHLLGYVTRSENSEGQGGIEKAYEEILKPSSSSQELVSVFDARGDSIPGLMYKLKDEQNRKGSVVLTIDKRVQQVVEKAMDDNKIGTGAVVVMDIHSKEILAMASRPTFNPYNPVSNDSGTFINKAFNAYNPGSLFKILISAAALEEGKVQMDEQFNCSGKYVFNSQVTISCWNKAGHGTLTFAQSFANSCNPTFIKVGLRLGRTTILKYVDKMHLKDETVIGYNGYDQGGKKPCVNIDAGAPAAVGNASLGQGGVMISPLQIASLVSTVADDGVWAQPSLVKYTIDQKGKKTDYPQGEREQVISSETAAKVRELMKKVVQEGTGKSAALSEVQIAGKTGTSETGEMNDKLNAWFAGFLPADQPRWAIVVLAEGGTSGGLNCGPVFKQISQGIIEYY